MSSNRHLPLARAANARQIARRANVPNARFVYRSVALGALCSYILYVYTNHRAACEYVRSDAKFISYGADRIFAGALNSPADGRLEMEQLWLSAENKLGLCFRFCLWFVALLILIQF